MTSSLKTSAPAMFSPSVLPVTVQRTEMQLVAHALHQRRQAAGVEEVLHQVGVAARPDVGDHRHVAAGRVEVVEADVACRRAAPCAIRWMMALVEQPIAIATAMRVLERGAGQDPRWRQVLPDHLDDAPAGGRAMRTWPASAAGIEEAPGSVMPIASAIAVMVLAVPMVMQWP